MRVSTVYIKERLFSFGSVGGGSGRALPCGGEGVLIFELSFQSRVNNFYRANFYPDIGLGLAQPHQFLSGKPPPAFRQNSEISIRTDLRNFKNFRQFLSGSGHGI